MKTIQFISESIDKMKSLQIPAQIQVGTFQVKSYGSLHNWAGSQGTFDRHSISFRINFRPDHIQTLLNIGVKIDFNSVVMANLSPSAKRFKAGRDAINQGRYAPYYYQGDPSNHQTGVIENWLQTNASCNVDTLRKLDAFCRDNHRDELAIHNDTVLKESGWLIKTKYNREITVESQIKNIKAIRRNATGKPYGKLQPIEKRALKLK